MSAENRRLLKALQNIREEFARAAQRQQREYKRQQDGSLFRRIGRWIGIYSKPDLPISYQSEQDQKRKLDADMVLWTRAVARYTKALVFVGVGGIVVAGATAYLIRGQLQESKIEQRPWVTIHKISIRKLVKNESFLFNPAEGMFHLSFDLTNTGHLPAVVDVFAEIVRGEDNNWKIVQEEQCAKEPKWDDSPYLVFPNDTKSFPYFVDRTIQIRDWSAVESYTPVITGCVVYEDASHERYQTAFYAQISHEDSEHPRDRAGTSIPINIKEQPIPANMLAVRELSMTAGPRWGEY
ncbi:MAG TPA: hypothetical protein VKR55_08075 [Bradyrhizobium sp.]|uniref:hypothetical protein n=1 Tax=Bradyrhizobium sp. TaxID=376 RepID=UPI002CB603B7|nr:hypothetical protein [Bradyrhizobium sp.]HLZ02095.1 hypothetical protein [Bradyrhizobium sp.]